MTDEAANVALANELEVRMDALTRRMNSRAKLRKLVGVGASAYLASTTIFNYGAKGPMFNYVIGAVGVGGLIHFVPAYLRYKPFEIDEAVSRHLTALDPSSDEIRLTSDRAFYAILRVLRKALRAVPPSAVVISPAPIETPAPQTPPPVIDTPPPVIIPAPDAPIPLPEAPTPAPEPVPTPVEPAPTVPAPVIPPYNS